jgi:hypothetical protein
MNFKGINIFILNALFLEKKLEMVLSCHSSSLIYHSSMIPSFLIFFSGKNQRKCWNDTRKCEHIFSTFTTCYVLMV